MTQDPNEASSLPNSSEFKQLVEQANGGDEAALELLRKLLDDNPVLWQRVGDLAVHTELLLIGLIAGEDRLVAESLKRNLEDLKLQLAGPDPTGLTRLAVERIAACWMQLQHIDMLVAKARPGTVQATFLMKRQGQADRAYNAALKSLTLIRQLLPTGVVHSSSEATAIYNTVDGSIERPATLPMHDGVVRRHA